MKRLLFLILTLTTAAGPLCKAQDAATEERLNKLTGQIEDLIAARSEQDKRIAALTREIESLREQLAKPSAAYADAEDLKRLAATITEVDRKRVEDNEKVRSELLKLGRNVAASAPATIKKSAPATQLAENNSEKTTSSDKTINSEKSSSAEKGYEYTIQQGDTLSTIAKAYREKNIKVSVDQILKANPGLVAENLRVGRKIFIPAPAAEDRKSGG